LLQQLATCEVLVVCGQQSAPDSTKGVARLADRWIVFFFQGGGCAWPVAARLFEKTATTPTKLFNTEVCATMGFYEVCLGQILEEIHAKRHIMARP
jgi:hypothetical protein